MEVVTKERRTAHKPVLSDLHLSIFSEFCNPFTHLQLQYSILWLYAEDEWILARRVSLFRCTFLTPLWTLLPDDGWFPPFGSSVYFIAEAALASLLCLFQDAEWYEDICSR